MKKTIIAVLCTLAAIGCTCSFDFNSGDGVTVKGKHVRCKGPVVLEEIEVTGFDQIVINGSADLKYVQTPGEWGVEVEANQEVFQYLDFHVEDSVLYLETMDHVQIKAEEFNIFIGSPSLKNIVVNGAADASVISIEQEDNLNIAVNGAGDIELQNITVPTLSCEVNGAGDIEATGLKVGHLSININGAGDAELSGRADSATFSVSGAGDIDARGLECPKVEKNKAGLARIRTR